jgi:hypothetical protein
MHKSTRLIKLLPIMLIAISACGYDGTVSAIHAKTLITGATKECEPPACEVDGNCTETLLGWDPTKTTVETVPVEETVAP